LTASGFDSEILSLQRKFGQWREDGPSEEHSDLLFYEYVEAVKLTGDNLMPAGQVWIIVTSTGFLLPYRNSVCK
jgi:hypothetical protein